MGEGLDWRLLSQEKQEMVMVAGETKLRIRTAKGRGRKLETRNGCKLGPGEVS